MVVISILCCSIRVNLIIIIIIDKGKRIVLKRIYGIIKIVKYISRGLMNKTLNKGGINGR